MDTCSSTCESSQMEDIDTSDDIIRWLCIVAASCKGYSSKGIVSHTMQLTGRKQNGQDDSQ